MTNYREETKDFLEEHPELINEIKDGSLKPDELFEYILDEGWDDIFGILRDLTLKAPLSLSLLAKESIHNELFAWVLSENNEVLSRELSPEPELVNEICLDYVYFLDFVMKSSTYDEVLSKLPWINHINYKYFPWLLKRHLIIDAVSKPYLDNESKEDLPTDKLSAIAHYIMRGRIEEIAENNTTFPVYLKFLVWLEEKKE